MVALQVIEQSLVHTRDVARIDKRGIHSFLFLQPGSHGFAQLIERAQSQYGDLLSTMGHLITVQRLAVILLRFYIPADNPIGRHANGNRMFRLTDAPLQHCHILLTTSRCQINHIRNITDDRNIKKTKMGNIIHTR